MFITCTFKYFNINNDETTQVHPLLTMLLCCGQAVNAQLRIYGKIDGMRRSSRELKILKADEIKNIQYYSDPPARYAHTCRSDINVGQIQFLQDGDSFSLFEK
jgi:hypothetical protein